MLVIALTLVVAALGVAMYLFCANPKYVEIGRILFFAGMLAFMLGGATRLVEFVVR